MKAKIFWSASASEMEEQLNEWLSTGKKKITDKIPLMNGPSMIFIFLYEEETPA